MARTPSAGDFTGKQKATLLKKAQQEQAESAQHLAMATASAEQERSTEVVDYTKEVEQVPVDTGPVDLTVQDAGDEADETIARLVAGSDGDEPEPGTVGEAHDYTEEANDPAAAPSPVSVAPVTVERSKVLIRSRYDLPQVTIGRGTLYEFEEGRQYYVPSHVAEHLAERDLVDILN